MTHVSAPEPPSAEALAFEYHVILTTLSIYAVIPLRSLHLLGRNLERNLRLCAVLKEPILLIRTRKGWNAL